MYPNPLEQAALDIVARRLARKAAARRVANGGRDGCGHSGALQRWHLWTRGFCKFLKDRAHSRTIE